MSDDLRERMARVLLPSLTGDDDPEWLVEYEVGNERVWQRALEYADDLVAEGFGDVSAERADAAEWARDLAVQTEQRWKERHDALQARIGAAVRYIEKGLIVLAHSVLVSEESEKV